MHEMYYTESQTTNNQPFIHREILNQI